MTGPTVLVVGADEAFVETILRPALTAWILRWFPSAEAFADSPDEDLIVDAAVIVVNGEPDAIALEIVRTFQNLGLPTLLVQAGGELAELEHFAERAFDAWRVRSNGRFEN